MLAICGGKGGCGKTTVTVALARALGRAGRSVTAVDCDRDLPDLHTTVGVERTPTLADVDAGDPTGVRQSVPDLPGVGVVPAPPATGEIRLPERLAPLDRSRTVVLLDCPAGVGPDAVGPLRAADRALLVTGPDPESLADTAKTAAVARRVGAEPVGTVLTRADEDPGVETLLGVPTLSVVPDVPTPLSSRAVADAVAACLPVV